ncbi:MAG TPA: hypothetical protein VFT22_40810 [Kofleriaceae bacterium]|nr:hypothetical protein [Kofleriaceae bacterium]
MRTYVVRMFALLILALAAACGRGRFDAVPAPDVAVDSAPDAAPPVLSCAAPRFSIGDSSKGFAAIGTPRGYDVFAIDGSGQVQGYSYAFDTTNRATAQLVAEVSGKPVHPDASGPIGAVSVGDDVLVAAGYGQPPAGTDLIPLASTLDPLSGGAQRPGAFGAAGSLARNGNGTLVFASQPSLQTIDLRVVSALGADLAGPPPATASDGATDINNPSVLAVGAKLLVVWNAILSPSVVHAQLFDEQLAPLTAPLPVSPTQSSNTEFPRAAYAPSADRTLVAWHQKAGGGDEVWFSLRNSTLGEVRSDRLAAQGILPVIAAGDDDFLVVWQDKSFPSKLSAARVAMDGTVTHVSVSSTGGTAAGWDVVVRNGQPALVWAEAGGTGPNLWIDPLCP